MDGSVLILILKDQHYIDLKPICLDLSNAGWIWI